MKKIIIILIICILVVGCSSDNKNNITQEMINDIVSGQDYIIVDVRTNSEYEDSHILGAINIPHNTIDKNVGLSKDKYILVYCKSGKRSGKAYDILKDLGYDVYNLGAFENIDLEKE